MEFISLFRTYLSITSRRDTYKIIVYYFSHICSNVFILLQPVCIAKVFDVIQEKSPNLLHDVSLWLVLYFSCFLGFNIFHRAGRLIEVGVAVRNKRNLSVNLYNILYHLPMKWHMKYHSGDIISRIDKASNALFSFGELQFKYIEYIMKFWGPLIAIFVISYKIAFVALGFSIVTLVTINKFDKIVVPLFIEENSKFHKYSAVLFDFVSNLQTIITLRVGEQTEKKLVGKYSEVNEVVLKTNRCNQLKWFFVEFCIVLAEIITLLFYIGEQWYLKAAIQVGTLVAIYQYVKYLSGTFTEIGASYSDIVRKNADLKSVSIIEDPNRLDIIHDTVFDWKQISIKNISFNIGTDSILKNISMQIKNGEKIAFVGESGSGKSTLLKILRGLYEIHPENIIIDNNFTNSKHLTGITTLLPQEAEVFDSTILYNITLGTEHDMEKVNHAVKLAKLDDVVDSLPHQFDSRVREKGVNLSGGEKQRLALARGLFAIGNSSLILLDEPTSHVDPRNEFEIYKGIFDAYAGRCIISAIHRLHLLHMFDYIYVFDKGRIIQEGSFSVLMDSDGKFKEMWKKYNSQH